MPIIRTKTEALGGITADEKSRMNDLETVYRRQMTWKLFIDDIRSPVDTGYRIARSSHDARALVIAFGLPYFISFDHDLGGDDTAMVFVNWLIEFILDSGVDYKDIEFDVHSANPIGRENIRCKMTNFLRVWKQACELGS